MNEHHTDEALRRAEPIDRDRLIDSWSDSEAKQALFQEITTMPVETPTRPHSATERRMPQRRLVPALVAATLLLGTGTVAIAAGGFVTENTPGIPEKPMGAFAETVEPYRDEFHFAPHRSFDEAVGAIDDLSEDDGTIMAIDGMTDMVGNAAVCSWLDYWRTATLDGDEAAAATAVENVAAAREWPWALVNTEFYAQNLSSHATAMQAGDVTYVTWELGLNCLPTMTEVPAIPPTGPVPTGIEKPTEFYRDADPAN